MTTNRRSLSQAEEVSLLAQVNSQCPLCGRPLFYKKKSREYKEYEIAHIYPLNPALDELIELSGVVLLNLDVNHTDNLIPLCRPCHTRYDKPRTCQEYNELAARKRQLLALAEQQVLQVQFPMEQQIRVVVQRLHHEEPVFDDVQLDYEPKRMSDKFDPSLPFPVRQKIKNAVTDYYQIVHREFVRIEQDAPTTSQLIYTQVKAFYLKQKALGYPQAQIFANIVDWIRRKADSDTVEAAEIVASFFVQNCEVFE